MRVERLLELGAEEDRDDRRRRLVGAEAVVLADARDRRAQQGRVVVDGSDHRGAEEQEDQVLVRGGAGLEEVDPRVRAHGPVVVLARAVDAGERLLVQQADEPVAARDVLQHLHRQHLVVDADVRVLEDRRDLVLGRRDLVVAGLDRHAELGQLLLALEHVGQHALGDRAEVVVVELVALRRLGAEQRAARRHQVGALEVVLLVDQEVLLLGADGREDLLGALAEQRQGLDGRDRQRLHRAQQRDLRVQRLARPRRERRRDAEQGAVGVLEQERRRARVPRGVAARLEGRADAARRERGRVRLALDELLAGELGDRRAVTRGRVEGVVLLGRRARERLEPVRVVGRAALHRPLLHRRGDGVGEVGVERAAGLHGGLELLVDGLGEALALDDGGEDVGAEDLGTGCRQIGRAERCAVRRPLRRHHVLGSGSGHDAREANRGSDGGRLSKRPTSGTGLCPPVERATSRACRLARSSSQWINGSGRTAGWMVRYEQTTPHQGQASGRTRAAGRPCAPIKRAGTGSDDRRDGLEPDQRAQHHLGHLRGLPGDVHAGRFRLPGDRLLAWQERRRGRRQDPHQLLHRLHRLVGVWIRARVRWCREVGRRHRLLPAVRRLDQGPAG